MSTSSQSRVSVVIPTWSRADLLEKCLQSLQSQTFKDFGALVVLNGAGEDSLRVAQSAGCMLVRLPANIGFAAGVNVGIAHGGSEYVLVLNDDVELDPSWLARTVAFLDQRQEFSYCCGKIYQASGKLDGQLIDNAGDALSLGGSAWRLGFGRIETSPTAEGKASVYFETPRAIWAVSATATLFRRALFEQIGNFDEDFFAYLEDMDLSLRAARAGLRGFYLPEATCRHWGSATLGAGSPSAVRLLTCNQLLLLAKHFPGKLLLRMGPRILWAQILWKLLSLRRARFGAYLAGVTAFLRLLPRAISRRTPYTAPDMQDFLTRLTNSEREIFSDVFASDREERDTFWRLYFALFPPRRDPQAAKQSLRTAP
jgi:GT2 family glycosyltransferase